MITFGTRGARNGKKGRGWPKFLRGTKRMKTFEGTHMPMRRLYGWRDCKITAEKVKRFLLANVGRPVDKVYSEFLKRCDSTIQDPKYEFFSRIEKKETIIPRWGGFYISNGILNYKKRKKPSKKKPIDYAAFNEKSLPESSELVKLCRDAKDNRREVFIGKFYAYRRRSYNAELVSVYIRPRGLFTLGYEAMVLGIGCGIYLFEEQWGYKKRTKAGYVRWESDFKYLSDAYDFVVRTK